MQQLNLCLRNLDWCKWNFNLILGDDDDDAPAGVGRVCIKIKHMEELNENIKVHIEGASYVVSFIE